MKRNIGNIARTWRAGTLTAAALSVAVATNLFAASPENAPSTDAAASQSPPEPPAGEVAETPPAIPALTPPPLAVSPGMEDIFKMARSGVSDEVLSAYVAKSGRAYSPSPEEIIYLKDLGVEQKTIADIIATGPGNTGDATTETQPRPDAAGTTENSYAAAPQPLDPPAATSTSDNATKVDFSYFQGSLSPYGSWIYVPGVGNCWRPTVATVNPDWRPYYDGGRWIYTDTGWYWLSDYSWGWAPFHYGRWHMSASYGWVWAPGYDWGPAWVSWRRTSTYCGWAPLPAYCYTGGIGFGYTYYGTGWGLSLGISWSNYNWLPYRYCYGYYPRHHAVSARYGHEIYNRSTIIRPTISGNHNRIIVNGPDARLVARESHTEIRRVTIRDVGHLRDPGPKDYVENGGRTLATFRPTVKPQQNADTRTEMRRGNVASPAVAVTSGTESRRGQTVSGTRPVSASVPARSVRTSGTPVSRDEAVTAFAPSSEAVRATRTSQPTPRLAGQNTTIRENPRYNTPAVQSTPILRDGRTIQYEVPVRYSPPVVAGGLQTESRRPGQTYTYPGATAVGSGSRQTVRTPTVTRPTVPATQGIESFRPTRWNSSDYQTRTTVETSRPVGSSVSFPERFPSRITLPESRPPTRSYSPPSIQSYSQPSAPPSRPSFSQPTRVPASQPVSRATSGGIERAPTSRPSVSDGGSRAPRRR